MRDSFLIYTQIIPKFSKRFRLRRIQKKSLFKNYIVYAQKKVKNSIKYEIILLRISPKTIILILICQDKFRDIISEFVGECYSDVSS